MTAKELRIGNYIRYEHTILCEVTALMPNMIQVEGMQGYRKENYYFSILISDEWLLKFGFKVDEDNPISEVCTKYVLDFKVSVNSDYVNKLIFHTTKKEGLIPFGYYSVNDNWGSINFEYIHQLQNLYFALTGEELKIINNK